MRIAFINPAMVFDPKDPFTTGVVYLPIGLAYGAAAARSADHSTLVLDVFGSAPTRATRDGGLIRLGLQDRDVVQWVSDAEPELVVFYANQVMNHDVLVASISAVRQAHPGLRIAVAENSQAVTAYQVTTVAKTFFDVGVDYLISGEMELRILTVIDSLTDGTPFDDADGISTPYQSKPATASVERLDLLPFPAWDLFPLENYWHLKYAHGPFTSERYLPMLTSRGCPFPCRFCVIPATNNRRWRARSPESVTDEIAWLVDNFGVREFHLEDVNPTISDTRIRDLCQRIISDGLQVTWKIVAGTKLESMKSMSTVRLMHDAGCRYVSISPESGSTELLRKIGKPFDVDYALEFVRFCSRIGIRTQTCFVLGFPEETAADRRLSLRLVRSLTWAGVDEIAVFVIAPVPGSAIYDEFAGDAPALSALSFSPSWRTDFRQLSRVRLWMYANFLAIKAVRHPVTVAHQAGNYVRRRFETKMEMVPFRARQYRRLARSASV